MSKIMEELAARQNVRSNLSEVRQLLKNREAREDFLEEIKGKENMFVEFLKNEDAKTRKNAALLLGELEIEVVDELYQAYLEERIQFVKSAYLAALSKMNVIGKLPELRDILDDLLTQTPSEENQKHVAGEIRELRKILIKYEGIDSHTFVYPKEEMEVILLCNREHREIIRQAAGENSKVHPLGVLVKTDNLKDLERIRTYRSVVFPVHTQKLLPDEPYQAAELLWNSDLYQILLKLHKEDGAFYYRFDCGNTMPLEKKSDFGRKFGARLEYLSNGNLINSASDYEVELRLIVNKEGNFFPCLKLKTWKDSRFSYRKQSISASINPSTAALLVELAAPYMKKYARILDPFCGVGTMLIERNKKVTVREMYGLDVFGEAIVKARENAILAKCNVNYINRDYFDFTHNYLFDEIITDMPVRGKKSKEEMDFLYRKFFEKAQEVLAQEGIMIMYSNEMGLVKKQLRMNKKFELLKEICIQKKNEFYLFVIGSKK